jgi:large subunit ribosomal protein L23
MKKDPYQIVKHQHVTEKARMLSELKDSDSNPCIARFKQPKYVFVVNPLANKQEIAWAIEEIYRDRNITVTAVNTVRVKGKRRRMRGRTGMTRSFKKAIVTLEEGDAIDTI